MTRLAGIAAFLVTATAAATTPPRVALERPAHPDPIAIETLTRLQAELGAAGLAAAIVDPGTSSDAAAVVRLVDGGADVWIAGSRRPAPHHLDAGATPGPARPAALAIRAVELLRATLLDPARAKGSPPHPVTAAPPRPPRGALDDAADLEDTASPARRAGPPRALLEGPTVEVGLTAVYGLGDSQVRLAPVLRAALGTPQGLAGRITLLGTPSDQAGLVEVACGFGRWWRAVAPVVSVGAGAWHTHLDDTATPKHPRLVTEAWGGALSAGAGVAARATDRAAFLLDAHAILIDLGPGAVVGAAPAGGQTRAIFTTSLGVVAGF